MTQLVFVTFVTSENFRFSYFYNLEIWLSKIHPSQQFNYTKIKGQHKNQTDS
jgi:hypothetical protein